MEKIKISIRYKLIALIISITLVSSFVGLYTTYYYIQIRIQENFEAESQTIAHFVGELVVPTIVFQDPESAYELISKLDLLEDISSIIVLDSERNVFSQYHKRGIHEQLTPEIENLPIIDTLILNETNMIASHPIVFNNARYGSIVVVSDYSKFNKLKSDIIYALFVVMLLVVIITFFLAINFQRIISEPIINLTNVALNVYKTENYSLRATELRSDEVGMLYNTFNDLMSKIEAHIIERNANEVLILENEQKYRVLFNYSPIPIFIFEGANCTMANHAAIELFHANSKSEIVDKQYSQLFYSNNSKSYEEIFVNNNHKEPVVSKDFVVINMSNEKRNVELTSMSVKNESIFTNIVMCSDISDKINFENDLIALNKELELRVKDRTSNLENSISKIQEQNLKLNHVEQEIRKAKDEAERANNIKSEFLAHISHEIRTPMNIIKGYSEMLYKNLEDPENVKIVKTIIYSSETLLSIINDMLDLSKIEAGKLQIVPTNVDLHNTMMSIKDMFISRIQDKGLSLIFDLDTRLPSNIIIDGLRLNQVFFNLLSNSIKFTDKGFIKVKCWHEEVQNDLINLYLTVQDTGIGIKKENFEIIFDAFAQERLNYSATQLGTGLGLTITKRLVESFNGTINVESEVGVGTTFKIALNGIEVVKKHIQEVTTTNQELSFDGKINALIIDDYALNRTVLIHKLNEYGIQCYEAEDFDSAVEMVSCYKFDIIFIDLVIPKINGMEIAQHFRKSKISNNCPLIAYSALNNQFADSEYLFDGFLYKPIKNKILNLIINKYLSDKLKIRIIYDKKESDINQNQLVQLIDNIDHQWINKATALSEDMIIDDIQEFTNILLSKSKEFKIQLFGQYTDSLSKAVANFDIKQIQTLLNSLDTLNGELKLLIHLPA